MTSILYKLLSSYAVLKPPSISPPTTLPVVCKPRSFNSTANKSSNCLYVSDLDWYAASDAAARDTSRAELPRVRALPHLPRARQVRGEGHGHLRGPGGARRPGRPVRGQGERQDHLHQQQEPKERGRGGRDHQGCREVHQADAGPAGGDPGRSRRR